MNLCYGDSPLGPSEKLERERPISHTAGKRRDSRPSLVNLTGKISVERGETRQGEKNPDKPSVKNDGANAADRQREEEEGRGEGQQGVAGVRVGRVAVLYSFSSLPPLGTGFHLQ